MPVQKTSRLGIDVGEGYSSRKDMYVYGDGWGIDRNDLATSAETVSLQTLSTVCQILSRGSSLLDCRCKWALCRCDMEGNRYKSKTFVYGPAE
jgi:hypothetical protein